MKTTAFKNSVYAAIIVAVLGLASCKGDSTAEGNVVGEPSQVDNYPENGAPEETKEAADTTSRAQEDSMMQAPSP